MLLLGVVIGVASAVMSPLARQDRDFPLMPAKSWLKNTIQSVLVIQNLSDLSSTSGSVQKGILTSEDL
jgi:hypothetical protein